MKSQQKKLLMYGALGAVGLLLSTAFIISGSAAQPVICLPGTHLEGELCVPDIVPVTCPTGYFVSGSTCVPSLPPRDSTFSPAVTIRTLDRRVGSAEYNVWVDIPQHYTGAFKIHLRLANAATNQEVAHETKTLQFANYGGGTTNNYFRISGLTGCTTYNVFAYVTSTTDSVAYSGLVTTGTTTRGCPASLLPPFSLFDWMHFA